MIYIVSGCMRSGTSMMMRCLEKGGIPAVLSSSRDVMNEQYGDDYYKPNGDGFYELTRAEFIAPGFPRMYPERAVKCLYSGLATIKLGEEGRDLKIIYMLRHPEEIRQSYEAFFRSSLGLVKARPMDEDAPYHVVMKRVVETVSQRADVAGLAVLQYRDVVAEPLHIFEGLQADGWPIDPVPAAGVVDPKRCRFRLEDLAVGI